jgi:hypothetical protein
MNATAPNGFTAGEPPLGSAGKRRGPTVEEMGECSFRASDPPAVWTWEVGENSAPPGLSGKTAPSSSVSGWSWWSQTCSRNNFDVIPRVRGVEPMKDIRCEVAAASAGDTGAQPYAPRSL